MIAFVVVRQRSVSRVTSGHIWPRPATNDRERGQLPPELQPPQADRLHPSPRRWPLSPSHIYGVRRGSLKCYSAGLRLVASANVRRHLPPFEARCCTGCCTTPPRSGVSAANASPKRPCNRQSPDRGSGSFTAKRMCSSAALPTSANWRARPRTTKAGTQCGHWREVRSAARRQFPPVQHWSASRAAQAARGDVEPRDNLAPARRPPTVGHPGPRRTEARRLVSSGYGRTVIHDSAGLREVMGTEPLP